MGALYNLKKFALGYDLKSSDEDAFNKGDLIILNSVSFFLAGVCLVFLVAFQLNQSVSLSWFFLCEGVAFTLIPILARQGYETSSKLLLISYVDIAIVILSSVFGTDMLIQTFFIPASGLSVLLFDKDQTRLRNIGIGMAIISFFILDYIIFDKIYFSQEGYWLVKWSVLAAAFICTWMIFNSFSEFKERAETKTRELLKEQKQLNKELNKKKEALEQNVRELKKAKRKVEEGSKAKTDFLSTMSHEIRTPMNAIIGMTKLLTKDNPREDQLEQIEILDFSAKTLMTLIDDILDFSKIESGKIQIEKNNFNLRQLIDGIIEGFRFTVKNKNVDLRVEIDEKIPETLCGDSTRLTQIINNLVSNAVKFTEEGSITIKVICEELRLEEVDLQFQINDTGVGIAEDKQEKIFESFTQERTDTTRIFGGTGLGLSICQKLVELLEGSIFLESTKHEGSTFYVDLTFERAKNTADLSSETSANPQKQSTLKGAKVLVVEDNQINQKVMQRFLERWDVNICIARNGKEALEKVGQQNFHVILMDLQMPEMDGYQATREIRMMDNASKRKVPIIALTAAALKEVKEKVYASGMDDFITKPFNPADLRDTLEEYVVREMQS